MSRTDILSEIKKAEADADAKVNQAEVDKKWSTRSPQSPRLAEIL